MKPRADRSTTPSRSRHVRKVAIIREFRYQIKGEQGQKATKANRIREVPLNATALHALYLEEKRQKEHRESAGDARLESGHVFTNELGAPLSAMVLTNAFSRCARKAGLPTTRMHDLRARGTQILGHSDEATTLRIYLHVIGLDAVRASRQIDRALDRHRSRPGGEAKKKARENEPELVALTGIESASQLP